MATKVVYEWAVEENSSDGDIVDSYFYDRLSDIPYSVFRHNDLVLVRNEGNDVFGMEDRYWAYVKDGKLPEFFSDGGGGTTQIRVPKRFHKELDSYVLLKKSIKYIKKKKI